MIVKTHTTVYKKVVNIEARHPGTETVLRLTTEDGKIHSIPASQLSTITK